MIERDIPRDISKYEAKQMLGLTTRQLCFGIPGLLAAIVVFFLLKDKVGNLAILLAILTAAPFLLFAAFKPLGMPLEKFIKTELIPMFLAPANRRYQQENTFGKVLKPTEHKTTKKSTKKYISKDPNNQIV
jgi:lipid II:glycine glycyltransferase (peptidoglycan interpeptide bridge formation enzyme)